MDWVSQHLPEKFLTESTECRLTKKLGNKVMTFDLMDFLMFDSSASFCNCMAVRIFFLLWKPTEIKELSVLIFWSVWWGLFFMTFPLLHRHCTTFLYFTLWIISWHSFITLHHSAQQVFSCLRLWLHLTYLTSLICYHVPCLLNWILDINCSINCNMFDS